MRWFLDTEFDENGSTIKLISIALVNEDGTKEYYRALEDGWRPEDCNEWVRANVLPRLPDRADHPEMWAPREQVRKELIYMLRPIKQPKPEIWGYFADYDWVALCQLFGTMMDLPEDMPMYCRDLKQLMDARNLSRDLFPPNEAHSALEDARWVRDAYKQIGRMA